MKIIDKTPLQDASGNINPIARVQGTLKYGLSWFAELEAQKAVITQLDRLLEKGFVLIRNFTLPNSEIVIPIILIGAGGIWVIYVTKEKGSFEAKGDQWNTLDNNGRAQPAPINFIGRVAQLTTALQKYLKIQKIELPSPIEAVLIAADPGAQIESVRPIARVVRSDAIKQFATSLLQARPVWRTDFIHELADRIIDPTPPAELEPVKSGSPESGLRSQGGFDESAQGFNANDLGFDFEDGTAQPASQNSNIPNPQQPLPAPRSKPAAPKKGLMGLGNTQIVLLAGMLIVECCVLIGFGVLLYTSL